MFNLLKLIGFDDACFHTLKLCNAYLFFYCVDCYYIV